MSPYGFWRGSASLLSSLGSAPSLGRAVPTHRRQIVHREYQHSFLPPFYFFCFNWPKRIAIAMNSCFRWATTGFHGTHEKITSSLKRGDAEGLVLFPAQWRVHLQLVFLLFSPPPCSWFSLSRSPFLYIREKETYLLVWMRGRRTSRERWSPERWHTVTWFIPLPTQNVTLSLLSKHFFKWVLWLWLLLLWWLL